MNRIPLRVVLDPIAEPQGLTTLTAVILSQAKEALNDYIQHLQLVNDAMLSLKITAPLILGNLAALTGPPPDLPA